MAAKKPSLLLSLPRELRDTIYDSIYETREYRFGRSITVKVIDAPSIALLVISKQISKEYRKRSSKRSSLVIHCKNRDQKPLINVPAAYTNINQIDFNLDLEAFVTTLKSKHGTLWMSHLLDQFLDTSHTAVHVYIWRPRWSSPRESPALLQFSKELGTKVKAKIIVYNINVAPGLPARPILEYSASTGKLEELC